MSCVPRWLFHWKAIIYKYHFLKSFCFFINPVYYSSILFQYSFICLSILIPLFPIFNVCFSICLSVNVDSKCLSIFQTMCMFVCVCVCTRNNVGLMTGKGEREFIMKNNDDALSQSFFQLFHETISIMQTKKVVIRFSIKLDSHYQKNDIFNCNFPK